MRLCECGCGDPAPIATHTSFRYGRIKGQPVRFISGHNRQFGKHVSAATFGGLRHGQARHGQETPEYLAYKHAVGRCTNPNDSGYSNYGGRGIEFRFASFEEFYVELGPRPWGKTLDRIDNDGHYENGNLRWATRQEQNSNRRPSSQWKRAA